MSTIMAHWMRPGCWNQAAKPSLKPKVFLFSGANTEALAHWFDQKCLRWCFISLLKSYFRCGDITAHFCNNFMLIWRLSAGFTLIGHERSQDCMFLPKQWSIVWMKLFSLASRLIHTSTQVPDECLQLRAQTFESLSSSFTYFKASAQQVSSWCGHTGRTDVFVIYLPCKTVIDTVSQAVLLDFLTTCSAFRPLREGGELHPSGHCIWMSSGWI